MGEKNKRKRTGMGGIVILVFLFLYIPSLFHWLRGGNIATDIIRMGYIEESVNAPGYIIRDTVLYKSPFDGKFIPELEDGERVAANSRIATVLKASSVKLLDMMEEKNRKIIEAQSEKAENLQLFSGDLSKLDEEIGRHLRSVMDEVNKNSLAGTRPAIENISRLTRKKAEIVGGASTSDIHINSLKKERDRLQEQLNANKKDILSGPSGIVSYNVDGYEEVLTPKAITQITPEFLEKIVPSLPESALDRELTANKAFAKVIKGSYYYIAAVLDNKEAGLFKEGESIIVRINDISREARCSIHSISKPAGGKCVVVVKLDRYMSETADLRKINADLVKNSYEGFQVPLKSLSGMDENQGKARIVLVKANHASIREVNIKGTDGKFAIISNPEENPKDGVSLYDTYIVDPKNVEEGQIIRK